MHHFVLYYFIHKKIEIITTVVELLYPSKTFCEVSFIITSSTVTKILHKITFEFDK